MKTITSRSNPLYRQWLADIKQAGRAGHGIWLEGAHLCQAWLEHRGQPQWGLFALEAQQSPEAVALAGTVASERQVWLPQKLLAGLSSLVSAPAVVFMAQEMTPLNHGARPQESPPGSCMLLDDVQDPGNVGTMLRNAAAAGIAAVYCGPGTAACWSPKVLRAGQGAQFALQIEESVNLVNLLTDWQAQDRHPMVLATALDHQARALYDIKLDQDIAWVFGHEGRGVSTELLDLADHQVFIPHETRAVESLNVASAAAICLFEQRRQMCLGTKP